MRSLKHPVMLSTLLAWAMLLFSSPPTYSQTPIPCEDQEFPYRFCVDGIIRTYCTDDPNNYPAPLGAKPIKQRLPSCYQLNIPSFPVQSEAPNIQPNGDVYLETWDTPPPQRLAFSHAEAIQDIAFAWNQWKNIWENVCGITGEANSCCIKVLFSADPMDFVDFPLEDLSLAKRRAAATWAFPREHTENDCLSPCDPPTPYNRIFLNKTNLFTRDGEKKGNYKNFFYTGWQRPPTVIGAAASMRSVMLHEFGHWFGFVHPDNDKEALAQGCSRSGMVMDHDNSGDDGQILTNADICMFKKLYCPEKPFGVEKRDTDNPLGLFENYPNPFVKFTNIHFALSAPAEVKLTIFSATGEVRKMLVEDNLVEGNHTVGFDGTQLPSGTYWYVLEVDGVPAAKKMILTKE